jgi:DNA polymerase-3 subunit epsilon
MNPLLQRWQDWRAAAAREQAAARARRWVLIDVETSGLDMVRDRLIAVAGVALHWEPDWLSGRPRLRVRDSLEIVLRAPEGLALDEVARRNILLHGIGRGEQGQGMAPEQALQALLAFVADAPCLGFHAAFDAAMLDREWRRQTGRPWPAAWLDLAVLARALYPEWPERRTLDDWLDAFGLAASQRHRASADAWASAELLQCLWPRWRTLAAGRPPWAVARELLAARRWLS